MKEAVIVGGCRSPIGRAGERGMYRNITGRELTIPVVKELLNRTGVDPNLVEDFFLGTVGQPGAWARNMLIEMELPHTIGAIAVNRWCASSLQSIATAAGFIAMDMADVIIAAGTETDGRVRPVGSGAAGTAAAGGATPDPRLWGLKEAELIPTFEHKVARWIWEMGMTSEAVAERYGVTREEADLFAYKSQAKTAKGIAEGKFKDHVIPITIHYKDGSSETLDRDQCPRADTTMEGLAGLAPVFKPTGVSTAGNSCPRNDGASAVMVMSKEKARELGLKPWGTIKGYTAVGVDPEVMGIGPWPASEKLVKRLGMSVSDFDLVELNEAFAVQAHLVQQKLGIPDEKLNVNGGATAIGHPFGATGGRLTMQLLLEMQRRDLEWGLATLCVGGGQGMSIAFQREKYDW